MIIVKRNGCIHVHNGKQFVKRSFSNVKLAVGTKAYKDGKPLSVKQILSSLSFDEDGLAQV